MKPRVKPSQMVATRVGTVLCHGVPANQSRSSPAVRSFGTNSKRRSFTVDAGVVDTETIRKGHVAGLHSVHDLDGNLDGSPLRRHEGQIAFIESKLLRIDRADLQGSRAIRRARDYALGGRNC
jgi:hypothetical protein